MSYKGQAIYIYIYIILYIYIETFITVPSFTADTKWGLTTLVLDNILAVKAVKRLISHVVIENLQCYKFWGWG